MESLRLQIKNDIILKFFKPKGQDPNSSWFMRKIVNVLVHKQESLGSQNPRAQEM